MATKSQEPLLPAYLIVGEDVLKRERTLERLKMRMEAYGDLSFNFDSLNAETTTGSDVVAACNTIPFASEKRLVLVTNVESFTKPDSEELVHYLSAPCETTILALVATKLAKNTRLYKAVEGVGKRAIVSCEPPKPVDQPTWIRETAPTNGATIAPAAAAVLADLVGSNTALLNAELRRLALAHEGSSPISVDEVYSAVSRANESKPWDLTDAMSERKLSICLDVLSKTSMNRIALLSMCTRRIREIMCAKSVSQGGTAAIAKAWAEAGFAKIPDWQLKKHASYARNFTDEELSRALISARAADVAMKSGTDPNDAFLDWLLGVVCGSRRF